MTGQFAPGTNGGQFSGFGGVSINNFGAMAFSARVTGGTANSGIFLFSNGTISPVALQGQQVPGTSGGTFDTFTAPSLNNTGAIAFRAGVKGGTARSGIFLFSGGKISTVALLGQVLPGTRIGLLGFLNLTLNDSGDIAFTARTFTQEAGNTQAIFLFSAGKVSPVVLPRQEMADGSISNLPDSPSLNNAGALAFVDRILVGPRGLSRGGGIFLISRGTISVLVRHGQPAPGTGGIFFPSPGSGIESLSLNNNDAIAFVAGVGGGSTSRGIFLASDGAISPVVLQGRVAPGTSGNFDNFFAPSLNNVGAIAFGGKINTGGIKFVKGIFLFRREIVPIALEGQTVPVPGGGLLSTIGDFSLNDNDVVAFVARVSGGVEGEGVFVAK